MENGDWIKTKEILNSHQNILREDITALKKTVLHMAVFAGHENIVKKLVKRMSENDLEKRDRYGYTALAETTLHGNCKMAEYMIKKNKKLVSVKSLAKLLPVVLAVLHRHMELARYLYRCTPLKDLTTENSVNGATLIVTTKNGGFGLRFFGPCSLKCLMPRFLKTGLKTRRPSRVFKTGP